MWEWPKRWPEGTANLEWCLARYLDAGVASKDTTRQGLPGVSGWRLPEQVKMLKSHSLLNPFKTRSKKQGRALGLGITQDGEPEGGRSACLTPELGSVHTARPPCCVRLPHPGCSSKDLSWGSLGTGLRRLRGPRPADPGFGGRFGTCVPRIAVASQ